MSKINNYEDLILEQRRLENDLVLIKGKINDRVNDLRTKLNPIINLISVFGNSNPNHNGKGSSLLKLGTSVGIDVMRQTLLAKSGWLTKIILPMILKGISSKVIDSVKK